MGIGLMATLPMTLVVPSSSKAGSIDELVAMAEGTSRLNSQVQREGIVFRPFAEEYDEDLRGRLSLKAINPKFLLKYDE